MLTKDEAEVLTKREKDGTQSADFLLLDPLTKFEALFIADYGEQVFTETLLKKPDEWEKCKKDFQEFLDQQERDTFSIDFRMSPEDVYTIKVKKYGTTMGDVIRFLHCPNIKDLFKEGFLSLWRDDQKIDFNTVSYDSCLYALLGFLHEWLAINIEKQNKAKYTAKKK